MLMKRRAEPTSILSLYRGGVEPRISVDGLTNEAVGELYTQISARLQAGSPADVREAYNLCGQFPPCTPEGRSYIDDARMRTGLALEQGGDPDRAEDLYQQLLRDPRSDLRHRCSAYFRSGYISAKAGKLDEAVEAYQQAVRLDALAEVTLLARQELAGILLLENRHAEALPHLETLLSDPAFRDPPRLVFHLWYGICLCKTGLLDRARAVRLGTGLPAPGTRLDTNTTGLWTYLASLLEPEQPEVSRELYSRFLEMEGIPGDVITNSYFRLGMVCETLTDWEAAARFYRQAMDSHHSYPPAQVLARFRLAEMLYLSEEYESAADLLSGLGNAPELSVVQQLKAQLYCGICLLRAGKLEQARLEFESCRNRPGAAPNGFEVQADLYLAELFESRGDRDAARECYQRVIRNPSAEPLTRAAALHRVQHLR